MGYTNYYKVKDNLEYINTERFYNLCETALKVIESIGVELGNGTGENRIDIKTAIDRENNIIVFNGYGQFAYETFTLDLNDKTRGFCKTARCPYDLAVKVICMIAQQYGILSSFDFDGQPTEPEYMKALSVVNMILATYTE